MGILDALGSGVRNQLTYAGEVDQRNKAQSLEMMQAGFTPREQGGGLGSQMLRAAMPQVASAADFEVGAHHGSSVARDTAQTAADSEAYVADTERDSEAYVADTERASYADSARTKQAGQDRRLGVTQTFDAKQQEDAQRGQIDLQGLILANQLEVADRKKLNDRDIEDLRYGHNTAVTQLRIDFDQAQAEIDNARADRALTHKGPEELALMMQTMKLMRERLDELDSMWWMSDVEKTELKALESAIDGQLLEMKQGALSAAAQEMGLTNQEGEVIGGIAGILSETPKAGADAMDEAAEGVTGLSTGLESFKDPTAVVRGSGQFAPSALDAVAASRRGGRQIETAPADNPNPFALPPRLGYQQHYQIPTNR